MSAPTEERIMEQNAQVLAALPDTSSLVDDTRTCHRCGLTKAKTVFSKEQDWPTPDQPLCRKCRDDARALTEEETADQKEIAALVAMSHSDEVEFVRQKRLAMVAALTPHKIKQASIKDLTIGAKNIFGIEQLLQDKPTQIVEHGKRDDLRQALQLIKEERERRQHTIDVTPKAVS